jgi:short-subunit dehydrogenase
LAALPAPFERVEAQTLQRNFEINTMTLLHLARLTTPAMVQGAKGH